MFSAFMAATKIGLNKNLRFIKFIMYAIQWGVHGGQIKAGMTEKQQGNERLYMQDNGQDIMVARISHVCECVSVYVLVALKQAKIYYDPESVFVCASRSDRIGQSLPHSAT